MTWLCDVCGRPANRMVARNSVDGGTYVRHLRCEPKAEENRKEKAPDFKLKGLGWSRHGYTKDFEG